MEPYVVMDILSNSFNQKYLKSLNAMKDIRRSYVTETGQGKNNLFWKVGLIVDGNVKLSVLDRDLKYDDEVGEVIIEI